MRCRQRTLLSAQAGASGHSRKGIFCPLSKRARCALLRVAVGACARRVHELAWTLDAGIRAGLLTEKHVEKLMGFFDDVIESEAAAAPRPSKRPR